VRSVVIHVVAGLGRRQGGPSYSVPRLCRALTNAGASIDLFTVKQEDDAPLEGGQARYFDQDLAKVPIIGSLRFSRSMGEALTVRVRFGAAVHVHGLWLMPNVQAGLAARSHQRPLIVSPRGMLASEALNFSRRRKQLFWALLQRRAYASAAMWHATSMAEAEDIRAFGVRAPIVVSPNGIDLPDPYESDATPAHSNYRTLLSLGRIHPKKGLHTLVRAWASLEQQFPDWRLRIVGPDELGYVSELMDLATKLKSQRISIEPPIFGAEKLDVLRSADLFVLPTLSENFGLAVAEALASCVPAVVTKGAPWSGLETEHCGLWIDHGAEPLARALHQLMSLPRSELRAMGVRGRAWMARDFSWERVAAEMLDVYRWLQCGGACPATVMLD
jgi:glycosyltransferase involved in cell wall biosynthesis